MNNPSIESIEVLFPQHKNSIGSFKEALNSDLIDLQVSESSSIVSSRDHEMAHIRVQLMDDRPSDERQSELGTYENQQLRYIISKLGEKPKNNQKDPVRALRNWAIQNNAKIVFNGEEVLIEKPHTRQIQEVDKQQILTASHLVTIEITGRTIKIKSGDNAALTYELHETGHTFLEALADIRIDILDREVITMENGKIKYVLGKESTLELMKLISDVMDSKSDLYPGQSRLRLDGRNEG